MPIHTPKIGVFGHLTHPVVHPVVPDIVQSRLECIDTGCIHRLLVQQIPPYNTNAYYRNYCADYNQRPPNAVREWLNTRKTNPI